MTTARSQSQAMSTLNQLQPPKNQKALKAPNLRKVLEALHPRQALETSPLKDALKPPHPRNFSITWMSTFHHHYHGLFIEARNWPKATKMCPIPFNL